MIGGMFGGMFVGMFCGLLACSSDTADLPTGGPALVRRMSLDLRGVLPDVADLEAAEADELAWLEIRDRYLDDPLLEDRLVELLAETWHTRVDVFDLVYFDYHLDAAEEFPFERAVGEEPLRLVARVAAEDLPWSEVVMADWNMADELLGRIWPVDYPAGATGWQVVHYTDGRPPVGVLASNGLWWRYTATQSNMNRARAAALSRLLLCEDYLTRPVSFGATDSALSTEETARSDPYCLGCHSSLDPIAASLFGFWWLNQYSEPEQTYYHPEREILWESALGTGPAWFGTPISGLSELGYMVATDSRFYTCAVETFAEGLWRRQSDLDDVAQLEALREAFVAGGTRVKPLLAAIMETESYRIQAEADAAEGERPVRMMTPAQLSTALEDLSTFRWVYEGFEQLASDKTGYRLLAGGVDGVALTAPQLDPGLTWALVVQRAAQAAAQEVVRIELEEGGEQRLLAGVTLESRPGEPAFTAALEHLHWRLYAARADADWLASVEELWSSVADQQDPATAWRTTLSALLRDPAFVTY